MEPEIDVGRLGVAKEAGAIEQRGERGPGGLGEPEPGALSLHMRARGEDELDEAQIDFRQLRQIDVDVAARLDGTQERGCEIARVSHGNGAGRFDYLRHVVQTPAKSGRHLSSADLPLLFRGVRRGLLNRNEFFGGNPRVATEILHQANIITGKAQNAARLKRDGF